MKNRSSGKGTALFILVFAAYAVSYLGRNTFAAAIKAMSEAGALAEGADGLISAAFLIFYGSGQLINGLLAMKISPRVMIPVGLIGSGAANLLMPAADGNTAVYIVLWSANGFFCSMLWPSVIRVLTLWMTKEERERSAANVSPSIPLGSIGCYLISFFMLDTGWENVFFVSGTALVAGGILLTVYMAAISGIIKERTAEGTEEIENGGGVRRLSLKLLLSCGLAVMICASFFNGTLKEAVISWIPKYLSVSHGIASSNAALISALMPAVSVAGPYVAAFLNKRFFDNECTTVAVLCGVSAAANLIIFLLGKSPVLSVAMLAVSNACMWGINTMLMTYTTYRFSRMGLSTAVSGVLNGTVFIGSSSFTVIWGKLADSSGWRAAVLAWTVAGTVACAVCLAGSAGWKKRRPAA